MKFPETQLPKDKVAAFYDDAKKLRLYQNRPVLDRCMFWSGNCNARPIGSHLIARSWLELIADEVNHVTRLEMITKDLGNRPLEIAQRLVGINNMTTFPGFCQKHDSEVFACLEKSPFTASREQLLALRYRSVCREACAKHQMVSGNLERALNPSTSESFSYHVVSEMRHCLALLIEKDTLEKVLREDGDSLESLIIKFDRRPSVLVSTTVNPVLTFTGRALEPREEWLTISIIPEADHGWAVFSWSKNSPKNSSLLAKSFLKITAELQTTALLNFVFEESESHAISPIWWKSLSENQKNDLAHRFGRSFKGRHGKNPPTKTLLIPRYPLDDWKPIEAIYI